MAGAPKPHESWDRAGVVAGWEQGGSIRPVRRQISIRLEERTLADVQAKLRAEGGSLTGYLTGLIVRDIYGDEIEQGPSEQADTVGDIEDMDRRVTYVEELVGGLESRLSRVERIAEGEAGL